MKAADALAADFLFGGDVAEVDPDTDLIIGMEDERQREKLVMIPSESIAPRAVRQVLASSFTNLYAEGYPPLRMLRASTEELLDYQLQLAAYRRNSDRRHYKGTEFADLVESLAQHRVIQLFANERAPARTLHANVQALSGAPANNAAYEAVLKHGDTIMGMALSHGGHLTHGSPFNRSGKYYNVVPYELDLETGQIDYDKLAELAEQHKPRLIVGGASAYPWQIDWARMRQACEAVPGQRALLMADIAHPAGLVVAGQFPNPVGYADIVTFTTHKTLIGPRGAVILTNNARTARRIDHAVFPGEQGGPHMNTIAALAVAFKIAATQKFRELQERTVQNAQALAAALNARGVPLAYFGTNTHLLLIDLNQVKAKGGDAPLKGEIVARLLDLCGLVCNKNTIAGDLNAAHSSAIRLGTTWATQRGLGPRDMEEIADQIATVVLNVRPIRYWGARSSALTGKIDKEALDRATRGMAAIVARTIDGPPLAAAVPADGLALQDLHRQQGATLADLLGHPVPQHYGDPEAEHRASQESVAVMDLSDMRLIEVRGPRARLLLQSALTTNLLDLRPGDTRRALALDKDAHLIDDVLVFCLDPDAHSNERFTLAAHRQPAAALQSWLGSLSDGYVVFDERDLLGKVEGPAVVRDVTDGRLNGWGTALFALHGPRALEALQRAGLAPLPDTDRFARAQVAGHDVVALRFAQSGGDRLELYVPDQAARAVWRALVDAATALGGRPAGMATRARLRRSGGLPGFDGQPEAPSENGALTGMIDLTKPYFVGQRALPTRAPALPDYTPQEYRGPQRPTCLYEEHLKRTSRTNMVPFAGWTMPVRYGPILDEHRAVRQAAGLFDISHMGVLEIAGPGATRFLELTTTNHVVGLGDGESHYSYVLDPHGNVLDDVFLYRRAWDRYMLVVNASNAEKIEDWLRAVNERRCLIDPDNPGKTVDATATVRSLKDPASGPDRRVDLALQGPHSRRILQACVDTPAARRRLGGLARTEFFETTLGGFPVIISRTGYTGEDVGFEIYVNPDDAPAIWNLLLERGEQFGVKPAGLAARDSTRTEAGFPLYGHELAGQFNISPVGAGYGNFVKAFKPFFIGRDALIRQEAQRKQAVVRFKVEGKPTRMVRAGDPLLNTRGQVVGFVTSNVLVPALDAEGETEQIGLAWVNRDLTAVGTRLTVLLLPRDERSRPTKPPTDLTWGDRAVLGEQVVVIPRFGHKRR